MSKSQALTLGGFILLGAVVAWQFVRMNEMQEANSVLLRDRADAAAAAKPAPEPVKTGTSGNAEPKSGPPEPGPRAEGPGQRPRNAEREANFRKMREMDRKQRQDAKLLALTTKLNLTAEQQTAIRAVLEKGSADRDALREAGEARRRAGTRDTEEVRRADRAKFAEVDAAQEKSIAATLAADQLAAYTEYKAEQTKTTVENRANQQLGDLLTRFSLTEDQKDAAFQFFAKQEEENGLEPSRVAAMEGDFVKLFEVRQKEQLEAFKQILTPDQYELYKAQQEQRSATFRNMVPGEPPPSRDRR